jgi:hypothetical protein
MKLAAVYALALPVSDEELATFMQKVRFRLINGSALFLIHAPRAGSDSNFP